MTCIDKTQISKWLSGKIKGARRAKILKLSEFFSCNPDYLEKGEGQMFLSTEEHQDTFSDIDPETFGDIQKWLNEQEKKQPGFTN